MLGIIALIFVIFVCLMAVMDLIYYHGGDKKDVVLVLLTITFAMIAITFFIKSSIGIIN